MIKNNIILNYTIEQLINCNIYLGYHNKFNNQSMFKFLLGSRFKISIINLSFTIFSFKKTFNILQTVLFNYGYLWLVDFLLFAENLNFLKNLKDFKFAQYRILIWEQHWYSGLLSNFGELFKSIKIDWKNIDYPSIVFFINTINKQKALKEPSYIKLPSINISDNNFNLDLSYYSISGNEKSMISLFFYYKILLKFMLRLKLLEKFSFYLNFKK